VAASWRFHAQVGRAGLLLVAAPAFQNCGRSLPAEKSTLCPQHPGFIFGLDEPGVASTPMPHLDDSDNLVATGSGEGQVVIRD
jgi:hypothetical protein